MKEVKEVKEVKQVKEVKEVKEVKTWLPSLARANCRGTLAWLTSLTSFTPVLFTSHDSPFTIHRLSK
ncbi:MAG TPA: hypothetical protein VMH32_10610 [Burkholderiales bacterium]|nr:hypothetical protein [Burkholderiales bacterium]